MNTFEQITNKLTAHNWKQESTAGKTEIDYRIAHSQNGQRIIIDHRINSKMIWFWLTNQSEKNCLGIENNEKLMPALDLIISKQDNIKASDYLTIYFDLQSVCDVSIMLWDQFKETDTNPPAFDVEAEIKRAQDVNPADVNNGVDDVVFPGKKVAKLSDYVKIMKKMQSGDFNGALKEYGLDMMSWGTVAMEWGQKLAADATLNAKFSKLLQQ
jgi:hypothetical protein